MCLTLESVCKTHSKSITAAENISLKLKTGELGALIGPSGCGKTTLLRMIAGFETPDSGRITIMGKEAFSAALNLAPEKRSTGMVFQDYALFPHLTVQENICFGPGNTGRPFSAQDLDQLLEITGLEGTMKKYPHQLSGGQQQRVALARALAPRPDLLLMDEPFSNLDISLRERLSEEVRIILKQYRTTGLLVTHNLNEAFAMADFIGVMNQGKLLQWDTAKKIYFQPLSLEVAGFVGEGSVLEGRLNGSGMVETEAGVFKVPDSIPQGVSGRIKVFIRPENLVLDSQGSCKARLIKSRFRGPSSLHTLKLASGQVLTCMDHSPPGREIGKEYKISIHDISVFQA